MADFQFNAGRVGGAHVGTVATADDLSSKLEATMASEEEKKVVMDKFVKAQNEYMAKQNPESKAKATKAAPKEKTGGAGKTLYDAVKNMMQ